MSFKLRLPPALSRALARAPLARPTRLDWARGVAARFGGRAAKTTRRTVSDAWTGAAHATADAAQAADHAAEGARARLKEAARDALAKARFGRAKPPPAPPRPAKSTGKASRKARAAEKAGAKKGRRKGAAREAAGAVGLLEAGALFALAGLLVAGAQPRGRTLLGTVRRLVEPLRGPGPDPEARLAEALEPGRGRAARSPLEIPPRGWKDVLLRTWREFNRDQIAAVAGGVTFFGLLAMFPALAAFVSLYGLFADVGQAREQLRLLAGFLPHDVLQFVGDEMVRLAGAAHSGLGVTFGVSLLVSLWSANGAVKALFHGLNVAYEETEHRSLLRLNLVSLAFTLGAIVFAMAAVGAVIVTPVALSFLGLSWSGGAWVVELRWPALLLLLVLGLSTVYRYGPSRQQPRWRWITPGGLVAAVLWVAASLLFSVYVGNFAHYDRTYGSLGAVIGFMFWLWYSTIIVLFGAELNSEIEHQTAVDSTTGAPLPMGLRGAAVADSLGRSTAKPEQR